jgi:hypothetical protein
LTSATSAATSYDEFDDRYLGAKSSPPSVDNDGNALLTGALYWNTVSNKMFVWSGTAWGEISSSADIIAYKYTVSAGATSVSGPDDNSLTLSYTVGKEQVYINGVLQVRGSDYTASTGSSITGMAALTASDIVTILAFTAFSVSNTYTQAEANALFIPDAIVDAKGDLIVATAADTVARLAAGNNGEALVADSSATTGLRYQTGNGLAQGTINGGFDVWQRGTSSSAGVFGADRWFNGGGNTTYTQESTAANLPAGFRFGIKMTMTGTDTPYTMQAIETSNAIYFAGKRVVMSYYVSSTSSSNAFVRLDGSTATDNGVSGSYTQLTPVSGYSASAATTTSMTRVYSVYDVPADTRTLRIIIGAVSNMTSGNSMTITGVQLEVGQVPTTFRRAGGTIQGELAACQRYYWRTGGTNAYELAGQGTAQSTTVAGIQVPLPVSMRAIPNVVDFSTLAVQPFGTGTITPVSAVVIDAVSAKNLVTANVTVASGLTQGEVFRLITNNSTSGYIGLSAEV